VDEGLDRVGVDRGRRASTSSIAEHADAQSAAAKMI